MERRQIGRWLAQRRFPILVLVGATIILVGLFGYTLVGPVSPETVRDRAIAALERKDARELCQLAAPSELNRLRLTPSVVTGVLQETLWSEPRLRHSRAVKVSQTPDDQSVWEVHWANEKRDTLRQIVPLVDDLKEGWKLNLSDMLYGACWRKEGGKRGMKTYLALARKYDIDGVRSQTGDYKSIDTLAQQVRNVFGE